MKKNPTAIVADDYLALNCLLTAREDAHHMWVGYTGKVPPVRTSEITKQ